MLPHPEHEIARRITELERRGWPDVLVWKPTSSASGKWEAAGEGWTVIEDDPSKFAAELERRLSGPGRQDRGGRDLRNRPAASRTEPGFRAGAGRDD